MTTVTEAIITLGRQPERLDAGPAIATPAPARRGIRKYYSVSQRGLLAADGSLLDLVVGDYVVSSSWRSPACDVLICWRPEVAAMVPKDHRWCPRHGNPKLPPEDLYPLEGDEWRLAERDAWLLKLAAHYRVPSRYHMVSFESCERTPALEAARRRLDDEDPMYDDLLCACCVIAGRVGCGKTTSLYATLRRLAIDKAKDDERDRIVFYQFPALLKSLLGDERKDTIEACVTADELILDDLGSSYLKPGGFAQGIVEEIFVQREQEQQSMLCSTNLSPREFKRAFGARVFDRLRGEWGRWIDVDGPSLRQRREKRT